MKYINKLVFFLLLSVAAPLVNASVVMTGTRIIFTSDLTEKTIQFKNPEDQPFIVQLQMTTEKGQPDNAAPFTLVPPVFRMESHTGQSVRLIYSGQPLPKDRESVFYLDFTQLPALKASQQNQNQLIIAIRNRVKVFYRPVSLPGSQSDAYKSLIFSLSDGKLNIKNPGGFFIPIRKAEISTKGHTYKLADTVMLSPKTDVRWPLPKKITRLDDLHLKLLLVNDYGVDVERERQL